MKLLTITFLATLLLPLAKAEREHYSIEQKQWGLATTAILTKRNHEDFYSLTGDPIVPRAVKRQKASLSRGWGISSRDDLIKKMEWVRDEGHRAAFDQITADREKAEWFVSLRDRMLKKEQAHNYDYRHDFVEEHGAAMGDKSLMAWDMARLVSLARWGVLCGYLEKEEAWDWIMPAAHELQKTYSSWEDLAENYLLGRQFWSEYYTYKNGYKYEQAAYWSLNSPFSPWNRFDWELDLTGSQDSQQDESELPEASLYFVAAHYDWGDQPQKALQLLLNFKDLDEPFYQSLAYERLGNIYEHGRSGISKDWKQALEYYAEGAELGDDDSKFELGFAHYKGKGRIKDFEKAMEYWQAAAAAGNVDGITNVGMLYSDGDGVEKNIVLAEEYYTEATRWGATVSENNMAWLMYKNPEIWDANEAVNLAYQAIYKWECNSHYDTLVKVLIKAERWSEAWYELGDWEIYDMRRRNNYDPLNLPEKFKRFRATIKEGINPCE
jgi:TPR repeat protein